MSTFTRVPFRQNQIGGGGVGSFLKLARNKAARRVIMDNLLGRRGANMAMRATSGAATKTAKTTAKTTAATTARSAARKALPTPSTTALVPIGSRALVKSSGVASTGIKSGVKQGKRGITSRVISAAKSRMNDPKWRRKMAWKAAKQVAKGSAEVGIDLLNHELMGGERLTKGDVKDITGKAGLSMVTQTMAGKKVTPSMVRSQIQEATRAKLRTKGKTGRTSATRSSIAERLLRLQKLMSKEQKDKRNRMLRGYTRKLKAFRKFGTGLGKPAKKPKKKTKRKPKKKPKKKPKRKPKKKPKKKKPKRSKKGIKTMNIAAARARRHKIKDVFDI